MRFLLLCLLLMPDVGGLMAQAYPSHRDQMATFRDLANRNRSTAAFIEYGTSAGGRALFALEIGHGTRADRAALLVMAGAEADDLAGPVQAERFAAWLLSAANADSVKPLLDRYTVYVIPRLSPDALEGWSRTPRYAPAGNDEKLDRDRDGKFDEDGPEDLNADGLITWMRKAETGGTHIPHPDLPFLMIEADVRKGQIGRYSMHLEGRDSDGDGRINEDAPGGVNLNRNMTYQYVPYTHEGGIHPFSSPEARALGKFLFDRPSILATFTFGPVDNIANPWKIQFPERRGAPNQFLADSVAFTRIVPLLKPHLPHSFAGTVKGDVATWAYHHAGRFSFTGPAWTYPELPDSLKKGASFTGEQARAARAYQWLKANHAAGIVEWTAVGDVEVGGFAPYMLHNPPPSHVGTGGSHNRLLHTLLGAFPVMEVAEPTVADLGNGVYRVTLTIRNTGTLPSNSIVAREIKASPNVVSRATLASGQTLVSGLPVENIREPIPGGGAVELQYLIAGRGSVRFEIGSPTFGRRTLTVNLR
jgi:hypothetical protein